MSRRFALRLDALSASPILLAALALGCTRGEEQVWQCAPGSTTCACVDDIDCGPGVSCVAERCDWPEPEGPYWPPPIIEDPYPEGCDLDGEDLARDPDHCGACGLRCAEYEVCASGQCYWTGAASVAAGETRSCLLDRHRIFCWGELAQDEPSPLLAPFSRMASVTAADGITCGLDRRGGFVHCWGPRAHATPYAAGYSRIAAGSQMICAAQPGGRIDCVDVESGVPIATPALSSVTALSAGGDSACALDGLGRPHCWNAQQAFEPPDEELLFLVDVYGDLACGLLNSGDLKCWSLAGFQPRLLGYRLTQFHLERADEHTWISVQVGARIACLVDSDSEAYCVDSQGELVARASNVVEIDVGDRQACWRDATGEVACAGAGGAGQAIAPGRAGGPRWTSVSVGPYTTCATREDGSLACWSELQDELVDQREVEDALKVSVGAHEACAHNSKCWGTSRLAQALRSSNFPFSQIDWARDRACGLAYPSGSPLCVLADGQIVSLLPDPSASAIDIALNDQFWCVLGKDHSVVCEEGKGAAPPPHGDFYHLSATSDAICGVSDSAGIVCWGASNERLARGHDAPLIHAFDCGAHGCCFAELGSSRVECWTYDARSAWLTEGVPSRSSKEPVMQVSVGPSSACALWGDGRLTCWGRDARIELPSVYSHDLLDLYGPS